MLARRQVVIAAALIAVVAGAGIGVLALRDEDSGSEDLTADLPPVTADEARATLSYLDGKGAVVMRMHEVASDQPRKEGREHCERVVQRLDSGAPVERVVALMDGVEDEPLRAAFSEERLALGVALTRCVRSQRAMPRDTSRLARATELSEQRLDQIRTVDR